MLSEADADNLTSQIIDGKYIQTEPTNRTPKLHPNRTQKLHPKSHPKIAPKNRTQIAP